MNQLNVKHRIALFLCLLTMVLTLSIVAPGFNDNPATADVVSASRVPNRGGGLGLRSPYLRLFRGDR
jgi:hypothetical protein